MNNPQGGSMKFVLALLLFAGIHTTASTQVRLAANEETTVKTGERFEPPAIYRVWWDSLVTACKRAEPKACTGMITPSLDKRQRLPVSFDNIVWRVAGTRTIACTRDMEDRQCGGRAVVRVFSAWNAEAQVWEFRVESTITLAAEQRESPALVMHEMLHVLRVTSEHPQIFRTLGLERRKP